MSSSSSSSSSSDTYIASSVGSLSALPAGRLRPTRVLLYRDAHFRLLRRAWWFIALVSVPVLPSKQSSSSPTSPPATVAPTNDAADVASVISHSSSISASGSNSGGFSSSIFSAGVRFFRNSYTSGKMCSMALCTNATLAAGNGIGKKVVRNADKNAQFLVGSY